MLNLFILKIVIYFLDIFGFNFFSDFQSAWCCLDFDSFFVYHKFFKLKKY